MRCAIDADTVAAGGTPGGWTDPAIVAGTGVKVRAVLSTELQSHVQRLWTAAGLGTVPQFTAGAITAGSRKIKASDVTDVRSWLVEYEQSSYSQQYRARVVQQYDASDGSTQFGRGKRTAM